MSPIWCAFFAVWVGSSVAGVVGVVAVWWRSRRADIDALGGVLITALAAAPSMAALAECVVRMAGVESSLSWVTRVPLWLATLVGPVFLASSGLFEPVKMLGPKASASATRVAHLCCWLCGAWFSWVLVLDV